MEQKDHSKSVRLLSRRIRPVEACLEISGQAKKHNLAIIMAVIRKLLHLV